MKIISRLAGLASRRPLTVIHPAIPTMLLLLPVCFCAGQSRRPPDTVAGIPVNYDEAKAGAYRLPDPLLCRDGTPVTDASVWFAKRRPELLKAFKEDQYGKAPARPKDLRFEITDKGTPVFGGKAIRRQVTVYFSPKKDSPSMDLLLYLPAGATGPVPVLLTPGFFPNASEVNDPTAKRGSMWGRDHERVPAPVSARFGAMDPTLLVSQGFGLAMVYYGDIEPDFPGGAPYGVEGLYSPSGSSTPAPDAWGAIAAWAWGLSCAMDYLETDPGVDARRVALLGVSRLGKTVLWTAAADQRFALVIASCSGEGGAALSRRNYGETIAHLTAPGRFPYQFCARYASFAHRLDSLPVDGHLLLSLIAPRPVLLQTGDQDLWSDPKGEFLAAVAAGPVYRLLGKDDLGTTQWPAAGQPILHTLGYYMHHGGHGTLPSDWKIFIMYLRHYLTPAPPSR